MVWTGWLFSQEWWRQELWRSEPSLGSSFDQVVERFRTNFIPAADANNLILQVLHMPSQTDLYFPVTDARCEAAFIPHCALEPISSLWGHPAGAGASPADGKFLNEHIAGFLGGQLTKK
jgi:homoserine O-acetyltransferase/O-succinyltransferase